MATAKSVLDAEKADWLASWAKTVDGFKRGWMNGVMMELVDVGNGFFQPIANRDYPSRRDFDPFRPKTAEQAKEHAWTCFIPAVESLARTTAHP